VIGYYLIRQFVGRVFVEPAAAPPRYVRVDHRATHVRVERGPVVDLAPRPVGLDQDRLEEILGVGPVPGEHDRHSQQGSTSRENIVTERGIVIAGSRFVVLAGAAHATTLLKVVGSTTFRTHYRGHPAGLAIRRGCICMSPARKVRE
jgi:hypothetical protein